MLYFENGNTYFWTHRYSQCEEPPSNVLSICLHSESLLDNARVMVTNNNWFKNR